MIPNERIKTKKKCILYYGFKDTSNSDVCSDSPAPTAPHSPAPRDNCRPANKGFKLKSQDLPAHVSSLSLILVYLTLRHPDHHV